MRIQGLKNLVGNALGYGRCPVTKDTYWHTDLVSVPYSESSGILVSARALTQIPKDEIGRKVFDKAQEFFGKSERYSLDKTLKDV